MIYVIRMVLENLQFLHSLSGNWYLLQFVEYKGKEDPRLYENPTYQEWLRVTGECQKPLPGEKFWKDMKLLFQYRK